MPLILFLVAAALLYKFASLLVTAVVVVAGAIVLGKWAAHRDDGRIARRKRDAEICARADRQHAAVLAGDYRLGVYGAYPPAV